MAQLFRVSVSHDASDSQTLTFVLPPVAATDFPPEILSREFVYAGHKWRVSLRKQDRHLSPYLAASSLGPGVHCWLDFGFVLIHRQTFTGNEQFAERQREFVDNDCQHGCRSFITLSDLCTRPFSDSRGEFLLELNLKNHRTSFEHVLLLTGGAGGGVGTSADSRHSEAAIDYQRYDTSTFNFGDYDWFCVFCPNMDTSDNGEPRHMVQLNQRGRNDSLCKLRYRLVIGSPNESADCLRSEIREETFDYSGHGQAFYFSGDYFQFVHDNNRLRLLVELYQITYVNHMRLNVLSDEKRPVAQCFDRDRQTWCLTTSAAGSNVGEPDDECLTLSLLYPDVQNIPANYLRYVSWSAHLLPASGNKREAQTCPPITAIGAPFEHYFSRLETDQKGFVMRTKLTMKEIRENRNRWLDVADHRLTVQMEWLGSHLLLHPAYHTYDDVYRKQVMQMRREVQALLAENIHLEKQAHNYQTLLANKSNQQELEPMWRPRSPSASSGASLPDTMTNVQRSAGGQQHPQPPSSLSSSSSSRRTTETEPPPERPQRRSEDRSDQSIRTLVMSERAPDSPPYDVQRQRQLTGARHAPSPPRKLSERLVPTDAAILHEAEQSPLHRVTSVRSRDAGSMLVPAPPTNRRSVDPDRYGMGCSLRVDDAYTAATAGVGTGLVRSKSASPYRHATQTNGGHWPAEDDQTTTTTTTTFPEHRDEPKRRQQPPLPSADRQLRIDENFDAHRQRSFRRPSSRQRKTSNGREARRQRSEEDPDEHHHFYYGH